MIKIKTKGWSFGVWKILSVKINKKECYEVRLFINIEEEMFTDYRGMDEIRGS